MSDKVITVETSFHNVKMVYYRGKFIGEFSPSSSDEEIASVVEEVLDDYIARKLSSFDKEIKPLLHKATEQAYLLGYRYALRTINEDTRDSLWNDIVQSLKCW